MKILMLVLAGSDFSPPATIDEETTAWVRKAEHLAHRETGGRLRPPHEAVVLGPAGDDVVGTTGCRVADDEQIVGFDVLECADLTAAATLVRDHPMARAGRIELRAVWDDVTR